MNCCKKTQEEIDPSMELKYGLKCKELVDLMQLRSIEASEIIVNNFNGVNGIAQKLNTNIISGLSGDENDRKERELVFGKNEIPPKAPKLFIQLAFEASQDTTLIILMICAILSIGLSFYHPPDETVTEEFKKNKEENLEWIEGVAILIAVIVVIFVTAFNDWRKEKQFRGLQEQIEKDNFATVVRNGQVIQINIKDLVVGDVCCIKYGDLIPADGIVIQSSDLKIDEASLTGETDLITKNDHNNMTVLSGTHVMEGSGKYLVTAVGLNSQTGIIFALLGATKEKKEKKKENENNEKSTNSRTKVAPEPAENGDVKEKKADKKEEKSSGGGSKHQSVLQSKLTTLAIQIGYAGTIAAVFTFLILCLRLAIDDFIIGKNAWNNTYFKYLISYLITGITVLVVSVPEGLPLAVTLSLAYAVRQMTKDNNLVRHLDACETMGSATTICSDKTGTLTTNRMTVVQCYIGGVYHKSVPDKVSVNDSVKNLIFDSISINSNYTSKISPAKQPGELPSQLGNKTECGLLGFVVELGGSYDEVRARNPTESFSKVYTFNSARKMMSTIIPRSNNQGYRLFTKGASEMVLSKCAFMLNEQGKPERLSTGKINSIITDVVEKMAMEGLRTICVAYRDFSPVDGSDGMEMNVAYYSDTPDWEDEPNIITNLTCLCLVGIEDPVRKEVPGAIKKCQNSGVVVRMVTGDNISTATSIALKCGIIKPGDDYLILESKDFNSRIRDSQGEISQTLLDNVWPKLRVLARSSPQDKYTLINGIVESKISANREVVAVTGDGTNDGPALKRADVGFAMGIQGTDVAKEASDIILTDDNFSSIVKAMMWGRNVYDAIAKFLQFQLTVNFSAGIISIVCAATIRAVPLKAIQMLWVNLVMDTLASLSLATEPPTEKLLERKPYGRTKPILSPMMIKNIVGHGVYQLAVIFSLIWGIEEWMLIDSVVKYNDINKLKVPTQHFTIIFNAFVMITLFNEINARKLENDRNVFEGIHKNPFFYVIWTGCFILQILIVNFGSIAFSVERLDFDHWVWSILFGVGALLWGQVVMSIPEDKVEALFKFLSRKKSHHHENYSSEINVKAVNGKDHVNESLNSNINGNNIISTSKYDLEIEDNSTSRILWLRGIGRINNQFAVISAFQQRLEEVSGTTPYRSLQSLREMRKQNSIE